MQLLLSIREVDVSLRSVTGETAFHIAAMNGKHEISKILYEKQNINIFEKDINFGWLLYIYLFILFIALTLFFIS